MDSLNYNHLHYFWVVAREGGLVAAGKLLRLSHPTLSTQIHALEERLGEKLFTKVGRKLALTASGRVAYRYAEEIFTLGREMVDAVHGRSTGQPIRLVVGVTDVLPKLVVRRLLEPALKLAEPVRLVCVEAEFEKLLAELALGSLDIVLSDCPVPSGGTVRAFNHLLGETGVTFFGSPALIERHGGDFPGALDAAPVLLPLENLTLRRALNQWFDRHDLRPRVVAEFEDSALMKVFGGDGFGFFAAPTVVEQSVCEQYRVNPIGRTAEVRERFYAVSAERRIKNPAVVAICEAARHTLFGTE